MTGDVGASRKPVVLLVDDEESVLSALRRELRSGGWHIMNAGSGPEALELLAGQRVAVIVADMNMAGMDGIMLLEVVKRRYPATIRILLTADKGMRTVQAAVERAEVFRYLSKPWDPEELAGVMKAAVERYLQESRTGESQA